MDIGRKSEIGWKEKKKKRLQLVSPRKTTVL